MAKVIYTKNPETYLPAVAAALKKIPEFKTPEWALFVKSGTSKQRPPTDADFWYIRTASILRQLYLKGVVGVGKLRTKYGSRKDRGGKPDKFKKAGGKIIRTILQQAETAGLVEKITRLQHGRRLTAKGRDFLDSIEVEELNKPNYEEYTINNTPTIKEEEEITEIEETQEENNDNKEEKESNEEKEDTEELNEENVNKDENKQDGQ